MSNAQPLRCHILDTGYCTVPEWQVIRGGRRQPMECHALVALIEHPSRGWGLWDTGYAGRMVDATERWPWRFYRLSTPLHIDPQRAAAHQLGRFGLAPADIRWIILSHLHGDHVAGLLDFPDAELILTADAFDDIISRRGLRALRRGYLPSLLPSDLAARARLIHAFDGEPLPGLGPTCDVFGDGALRLVALPGHARGQVGLLLDTAERTILLAADGAWHSRAIREQRPPHPLTYAIVDDARAVRETLANLRDFAAARPEVAIMPTHCTEVFEREIGR